jgi:hypothetical protein
LGEAQKRAAAEFPLILRKCLQGSVSSPLQRAFQLSNLLIGFNVQAPPLAFGPQFQQGVLQQRQSPGLMAHVLDE